MMKTHYEAYEITRQHAVELDFEKYCDIYEISRTDMEEAAEGTSGKRFDADEANSLKALKFDLQKLHILRKLFLCSLLALDANGGKSDFARWTAAAEMMKRVCIASTKMTSDVDDVLSEEEGMSTSCSSLERVT